MPKLDVYSNPDAQIVVLDSALRIIERAVEHLSVDLKAGLYKVKTERGGGTAEQLVDLEADTHIDMSVERFPAVAPIGPLLGLHRNDVERLCSDALAGRQPRLLFVGHGPGVDDAAASALAGLRIKRWNEAEPCHAADDDSKTAIIGNERWAVSSVAAEPGCYVIEFTVGSSVTRQTVFVAPNWQTRVFVRRGAANAPDFSIQMARTGTPVVYDDHYQTIEVARNALELTRPIFVSRRLVDDLLGAKFDNPIAGLAGLHLFLEGVERETSPTKSLAYRGLNVDAELLSRWREIAGQVIGNLRGLLGDCDQGAQLPSDLAALQARAGLLSRGEQVIVREPPMFWASWGALRTRGDGRQRVAIDRALWSNVAHSTPCGPYFSWHPRHTTLKEFIEQKIGSAEARLKARHLGIALDVMAAAAPSTGDVGSALDGRDLARALGIPDFGDDDTQAS